MQNCVSKLLAKEYFIFLLLVMSQKYLLSFMPKFLKISSLIFLNCGSFIDDCIQGHNQMTGVANILHHLQNQFLGQIETFFWQHNKQNKNKTIVTGLSQYLASEGKGRGHPVEWVWKRTAIEKMLVLLSCLLCFGLSTCI